MIIYVFIKSATEADCSETSNRAVTLSLLEESHGIYALPIIAAICSYTFGEFLYLTVWENRSYRPFTSIEEW